MNEKLDLTSLQILEKQLEYENMMNKKFHQYATYCADPQLKSICYEGAQLHGQNFKSLLGYLTMY